MRSGRGRWGDGMGRQKGHCGSHGPLQGSPFRPEAGGLWGASRATISGSWMGWHLSCRSQSCRGRDRSGPSLALVWAAWVETNIWAWTARQNQASVMLNPNCMFESRQSGPNQIFSLRLLRQNKSFVFVLTKIQHLKSHLFVSTFNKTKPSEPRAGRSLPKLQVSSDISF